MDLKGFASSPLSLHHLCSISGLGCFFFPQVMSNFFFSGADITLSSSLMIKLDAYGNTLLCSFPEAF